ncbi:MAG: septation protein SpoVG family protein [Candidatus Omnitrophota bacterium]
MDITEVRVFLKDDSEKKLKAYATITFDDVFVVRNIKVIEGNNGLFVAMPSRKVKQPCPKCNFRNDLHSRFCNHCGGQLAAEVQSAFSEQARQEEHKDVAHPINQRFREYLQKKVLEAYDKERSAGTKTPSSPTSGNIDSLGLHNV